MIRTQNQFVAKDGTVVCTDERTLRDYNRSDDRLFDFEITVHASHGELTLGDTKEGTMAVRLAETMRLKPNKANDGKPNGHIVTSEGVRDGGNVGETCGVGGLSRSGGWPDDGVGHLRSSGKSATSDVVARAGLRLVWRRIRLASMISRSSRRGREICGCRRESR